ncbi:transposase [Lederbergia sp. NSJ-179]|nr:transposase [Lederbergia sp. NSJ-179]
MSTAIKKMVQIKDDVTHRDHQNCDVIMQKIFQNTAGYHADDHADFLKHDPALTTVLDKEELASQPTMSRLNQKLDKDTMKQFQEVNRTIIDRFHELDVPEILVLDIDSTNFPTYGDQYGSSFNFHYGENGYHPILMFEGETGDCLKAALRRGSVYTSRQIHVFYGEFTYKAGSWNKSRKVMLKLEKPADELFFIPTFVVTTLADSPKKTIQFYAARGTMENFIKEGKLGFAFGKMSSTEFEINANKLQIAVLAYNLNNGLRRFGMPKEMKKHRIQTIRMRLIKIAGRIIHSGRYITFKLSSSSLYKGAFFSTLNRIQQLPVIV